MRPERQQLAGGIERRDHRRLASPFLPTERVDALAGEQRHVRIVGAVLGDRVRHLDAVGDAQLVVVGAMARRDVHEARAGIGRDEVARAAGARRTRSPGRAADAPRSALRDRRPRHRPASLGVILPASATAPTSSSATTIFSPTLALLPSPTAIDLDQRVVDLRAVGDRAVARHGPGRRRPDDDRRAVELAALRLHDREAHADRVRGVVVVLDLGLGQRGLLDHRPQHRPSSPGRARRSSGTCRSRPRSRPRTRSPSSCRDCPSRRRRRGA